MSGVFNIYCEKRSAYSKEPNTHASLMAGSNDIYCILLYIFLETVSYSIYCHLGHVISSHMMRRSSDTWWRNSAGSKFKITRQNTTYDRLELSNLAGYERLWLKVIVMIGGRVMVMVSIRATARVS